METLPKSGTRMNAGRGTIRCAVYTRTSSDERLNLELNSLDVQREACMAFITSQRHEGWLALNKRYDDGGFSGGDIRRPALRRLLDDVTSGKVDTIVVYKMDRLTRSLSDFAKIMDTLDAARTSFVSVTQSFNTQTSMGRLTLNVLLSFAQFERELGSERVRDRIAAAKARGIWTGGTVPLGYDLVGHKLVPNEGEARTVRHIMQTYLRLGSVTESAATLEAEGIRTKIQPPGRGRGRGGIAFGFGALRYLLSNGIYVGKVGRAGQRHEGQHQAIVPNDVWDQVQAQLKAGTVHRRCGRGARNPSLLTGMIWDQVGRRMSPSHTNKGTTRYRYYCSNDATLPTNADKQLATRIWRIPAKELETAVRDAVANALLPCVVPSDWLERRGADAWAAWAEGKHAAATRIIEGSTSEVREFFLDSDLRVVVDDNSLQIELDQASLINAVVGSSTRKANGAATSNRKRIEVPATVRKCGRSIRLMLVPPGARNRNPALIKLITAAFAARAFALEPENSVVGANNRRKLFKLARLSYLAPDIVEAVLQGEQPPRLTATKLRRTPHLPLRWSNQRELLGFPPACLDAP